jgi:hypothetical protein
MVIAYESEDIARRHKLLRKESSNEGLTLDEVEELTNVTQKIEDLNSKLISSSDEELKETLQEIAPEKPEREKLVMKPSDRKDAALEIIEEMRAKKAPDKEIIKEISLRLKVSNTYGYKLVKGK